jgi:Right handed beta helix region
MNRTRFTFNILVMCALLLTGTSLVHAQATRTWVSGVGDDVNPCSRTAPCKTFAGAISKTAVNGEIDALDPGGYGAVTITKSIWIDGTGTYASILATGTTGVVINLTAASDPLKIVRLRAISINGTGGGTRSGIRGINVSSANTSQPRVLIDDVIIDNFVNEGILFNANGGHLTVYNTTVRNNGTAGLRADSNGANLVFVTIGNSQFLHNAQEGVRFEDSIRGTMNFSSSSNNGFHGVTVISTVASQLEIANSTIANNAQNGVFSINGTSTVRIAQNEIINNVTNGLSIQTGGQICSNTRNRITTPTQASNCAFTDQ